MFNPFSEALYIDGDTNLSVKGNNLCYVPYMIKFLIRFHVQIEFPFCFLLTRNMCLFLFLGFIFSFKDIYPTYSHFPIREFCLVFTF